MSTQTDPMTRLSRILFIIQGKMVEVSSGQESDVDQFAVPMESLLLRNAW